MARYNKIYAGPWREVQPQVREAVASVALTPGTIAVIDGSGEFAPAGAAPEGQFFVVQDNYLTQKTVDTDWSAGDRAIGMVPLAEQFFYVRLADAVSVAVGDPLAVGAGGELVVPVDTTNERVCFHAEETYNNDTGSAQLVRVRPAGA